MPHPLSTLLARPRRATACLLGAGALLLLLGGINGRGDAADADLTRRHETALRAIDHLDALEDLVSHLDDAAVPDLKRTRGLLGADMIALRELARPGNETAALGDALAALALYQTAWMNARDWLRANDADSAGQARAVATPLGVQATAALASLGHAMDDGNLVAAEAQATRDRAGCLWNAGLALVAAGMLLFATGRFQEATIRRESLAS